jgi:hypothetical protein
MGSADGSGPAAGAPHVSELVEYELADGTRVLVEVEESGGGAVTRRGRRGLDEIVKADGTLEQALRRIGPMAAAAFDQLRSLANSPDEIDIEFGVKLHADFGAIIAKTGGEANFQISLRWRKG